ncbi:MAG: ribonuclease III [Ignavibacteriae bacterium]|nr:ribonuclease III [Ignavibacteriota bacterium]NOG98717.1 ribonuclease III [Ignavibacteriota bacterium]
MLKFLNWFKKNSLSNHSNLVKQKISNLENILGYRIDNPVYYIKALTHRSYLEIEPELGKSNERLEYLGDSALGFIVAEFLFSEFPDEGEGFLTKYRSHFVDKQALVNSAEYLNLNNTLLYNSKFINDSYDGMRTILADSLEALIGAIYLDKGFEMTSKFVHKNIIEPIYSSGEFKKDKNYKGQLLELAHSKKQVTPVYQLVKEEGPEHGKTFTVTVKIENKTYAKGNGRNKKTAEQQAAKKALQKLIKE